MVHSVILCSVTAGHLAGAGESGVFEFVQAIVFDIALEVFFHLLPQAAHEGEDVRGRSFFAECLAGLSEV
jgi:hypothetical protein